MLGGIHQPCRKQKNILPFWKLLLQNALRQTLAVYKQTTVALGRSIAILPLIRGGITFFGDMKQTQKTLGQSHTAAA
jgi:hypothetical protein